MGGRRRRKREEWTMAKIQRARVRESKKDEREGEREERSSREANDCDSSNYRLAPKVLGLARLPNGK